MGQSKNLRFRVSETKELGKLRKSCICDLNSIWEFCFRGFAMVGGKPIMERQRELRFRRFRGPEYAIGFASNLPLKHNKTATILKIF